MGGVWLCFATYLGRRRPGRFERSDCQVRAQGLEFRLKASAAYLALTRPPPSRVKSCLAPTNRQLFAQRLLEKSQRLPEGVWGVYMRKMSKGPPELPAVGLLLQMGVRHGTPMRRP